MDKVGGGGGGPTRGEADRRAWEAGRRAGEVGRRLARDAFGLGLDVLFMAHVIHYSFLFVIVYKCFFCWTFVHSLQKYFK